MPDELPLQSLHVLLMNDEVETLDKALKGATALQRYELSDGLPFTGALFVARPSQTPPPWLQFVQTGVDTQIGALQNRSNWAVLLIEAHKRVFALTFGQGRYLLDQEKVVDDFGLRVALNGLRPDNLRALDSMQIEGQTVHVTRQTSRASAVDAFGVDVARDIVRGVTGKPREETGLHHLSGREGTVAMAARVEFRDLGRTCGALKRLYEQRTYRQHFSWVDNVRRVKARAKIEALDKRLLKALRLGRVSAAVPEIIDWIDFDGYVLPRVSGPSDEPDLVRYVAATTKKGVLDVDRLKRDRLLVKRVTTPESPLEWPLYRCLLFETQMGNHRCVLSAGEWYQVADSLTAEVSEDVSAIPVSRRTFPALRQVDGKLEIECDYNTRVARADKALSLLDRKLVKCRDAATTIEACDLLSDKGELIHVKPRSGSSTLSHLFWQARVSAEALLGDAQFREEVRERLREQDPAWIDRFPHARPDPGAHEIVFALLGSDHKAFASRLPFFSQLTLSRTSRYLRSTGFRVSQIGIPVEE